MSTPLGSPVVPPVYIRIDGVVLVGLRRHDWLAGADQVLVGDVVGHVALADEDDLLRPRPLAPCRWSGAKIASTNTTLHPRVGQDELQLLGRQAAS